MQYRDPGRLLIRQILCLTQVLGKIEEGQCAGLERFDELPVACADHTGRKAVWVAVVVRVVPVQGIPSESATAREDRNQVFAVNVLYDHAQDAREMKNIAANPACQDITSELSGILNAGWKAV